MRRDEFMAQIARLLADMPDNERMEAIRYYNDYLDDAGTENENAALSIVLDSYRELFDLTEVRRVRNEI